jgi:hypothetical protein
MKTGYDYAQEVKRIAYKAQAWRLLNPTRTAKVQFNFPQATFLISTVSDALRSGLLSTDEGGEELIKHCSIPDEHTVCMLRIALELEAP